MLAPALFNLYFDIVIRMAIDKHCQEGRGVHIVYHPDAKLVGDHRKMTMETLVTDLEYVDDMALAHPSQPRCVCVCRPCGTCGIFSVLGKHSLTGL